MHDDLTITIKRSMILANFGEETNQELQKYESDIL